MATADLGIRIVLTDTASAGFAAFGVNLGSMLGVLVLLSQQWSELDSVTQKAIADALAAQVAYKAFSGGLEAVTNAAGDLQASMIQVNINVKGATDRAADMQTTLTNLADYSIYSSKQVADGFVMIGQRAFSASDIIDKGMGKSMVNLAMAINSDTVPAGNLLASAMREWNASADQSAYYADALTFAYHNGVPDVNALQQALMQAGAMAVAMGMPFKDFVVILDKLGQAGLSGSQAATSLRYMLGALADPTAKALKEMGDLGVMVVNHTTPAIEQLREQTEAYSKTPLELTGTISDLQKLYTEANKVGTLHTDKTFYQWALATGAVTNSLYDANGNFKNMGAFLDVLGPKLANLKTPEDFNAALENMFSVRGGKGANALLANLTQTQQAVGDLSAAFDQATQHGLALQDANAVTSGYNSSLKELGSTFESFKAQAGLNLITVVTPALKDLNNTLNGIRTHAPWLVQFAGYFLAIGTALSGAALAGAAFSFAMGNPVIAAVLVSLGEFIVPALVIAAVITLIAANWSRLMSFFQQHQTTMKLVASLLAGIGIVILINLLPAIITLVGTAVIGFAAVALGAIAAGISMVIAFLPFIVIGLVIGAVIFGVVMAITHWGQIGPWLHEQWDKALKAVGQLFNNLKEQLTKWKNDLVDLFDKLKVVLPELLHAALNGLIDLFHKYIDLMLLPWRLLVSGIQTVIRGGFQLIQNIIHGAINFIVGLFTWLYNHNYYFHDMVEGFKRELAALQAAVSLIFNTVRSIITSVFDAITTVFRVGGQALNTHVVTPVQTGTNQIKTMFAALQVWLGEVWKAIQTVAMLAWQGFYNVVIKPVQQTISEIQTVISAGMKWLQNAWDAITTAAGVGWHNFINSIITVVSAIGNTIQIHVVKPITDVMTDLVNGALKWGQNLISQFVKGITDGLGKVKDAAGGIAGGVTKFLGFHSPTEEGPGAESHLWAPNFIRMFAGGLTNGIPQVKAAAMGIAAGMNPNVSLPSNFSRSVATAGAGGTGGGDIYITVPVDGKPIVDAVYNQTTRQLRRNGAGRTMR